MNCRVNIDSKDLEKELSNDNTNDLFVRSWNAVKSDLSRRARRLSWGNRYQAEELLANTAIKALLYLRAVPERVRDPQGFMFLVLDHVHLDGVRKSCREARIFERHHEQDDNLISSIAAPTPSPEEVLDMSQRVAHFERAYAALNEAQRQLFQMRFEQDLPYPQIAKTLHINEALARKRVELLRKKLLIGIAAPRTKRFHSVAKEAF